MTLQAVEPVRVTVPDRQDWVEPEWPARCQIPECWRVGSQWHHAVSRTATAGPKDWIAIDGVVVWNKVRVCMWCHEKINNHGLWVAWDDRAWAVFRRYGPEPPPSVNAMQQPKTGDWFAYLGDVE